MILLFNYKTIIFSFRGLHYIADNPKEFSWANGHMMSDKYSLSIDLGDLESNKGKKLYNDGDNIIYVRSVESTGNINTGGYKIHFQTRGHLNNKGVTLMSGIKYLYTSNGFDYKMSADMTAEYKNKIYNCNVMGITGFHTKDGDIFSFYIFPSEAYDKDGVTLDENGIVKINVSNLYYNEWMKIK